MTDPPAANSSKPSSPVPPKWSWKVWGIWSVALSLVMLVPALTESDGGVEQIFVGLAFGPFAASMYYGMYFGLKRFVFRFVERQFKAQTLSKATDSLQEELDQDFFTNLVRINFKYLDKYYLQTQEQGDKSFLLCVVAAIGGLLVIVVGIVMMFLGTTEPAYVTTAAGVLSEFVSAVFFYLYNKTVTSMGEYHQKLVITQNIAVALKITAELPPDEKTKAHISLVEALSKDVNQLLAAGATQPSSAR